ncbi:MAG: AAA family ATPase [Bacteroidetes bacterium]|nr:AAA family ATPase [Bacteroidota bacterium]
MQRIIITGGPGFGKTTILNHLQNKGFNTFDEVARIVIKEEMEIGSDVLPWKNLDAFSKKVLPLQIVNHKNAVSGFNFYDRGIPDIAAYQIHGKQTIFKELDEAIKDFRYHSTAFITPPWKEIYGTDNERKESFEKACAIHFQLTQTYTNFGYLVVEVPQLKIEDRAQFILDQLNA